jgi:ElaB/YqjD/DUF883 family membrane-anchored ribosome-binding protein
MNTAAKSNHDATNTAARGNSDGKSSGYDRSKDKLLLDLKTVVADAEQLIREATDASADTFATLRGTFDGKVREATARLGRVRSTAVAGAQRANDSARVYVSANPWKSAGLLAATGVILGYALARWQPSVSCAD